MKLTCLLNGHHDVVENTLDIKKTTSRGIFEPEITEQVRVEIVRCQSCDSQRAYAYSCCGQMRLSVPFAKMLMNSKE